MGKLSESDRETANIFNKAFQTVFMKEDGLNQSMNLVQYNFKGDDIDLSMSEILVEIDKLEVNKSSGPDDIPACLVKRLQDVLIKPITMIFNKSLLESAIPEVWRYANVIPIYKSGQKDNPLNYRYRPHLHAFSAKC